MAIDFPATPTLNQQFSAASSTWKWDGTAWNLIPQMTPATASDTPPANPAIGQLWWRASNGQLYIWYDDGNTRQWVQTSTAVAPVPGYWEPIANISVTSPAVSEIVVPADLSVFRDLRASFRFVNSVTAGNFHISFSDDGGATWPGGTVEYTQEQLWGNSTSAAGAAMLQGATYMLSLNGQNVNGPYGCWGHFQLTDFNQTRTTGITSHSGLNAGTAWFVVQNSGICGRITAQNKLRVTSGQLFYGHMFLEGIRG